MARPSRDLHPIQQKSLPIHRTRPATSLTPWCKHPHCRDIARVEHDHPEDESKEICYQESEDNEVEAFADFLRYLDEHYGPSTSRCSAQRIHILVKPGDKHEDFKDNEFP